MKSVVYMLCGLTGSGKTTYAKKLQKANPNLIRLSVDEIIFDQYGRYGEDYPEEKYFEYYEPAVKELDNQLIEHLKNGKSVIIDTGFWTKAERDRYKKLIEEYSVEWKLVYFKTDPEVLFKRLNKRNKRADANALKVTEEALGDFIKRFEEPSDEGEELEYRRTEWK